MPGLYLNSYPLTLTGQVECFRLPGAGRDRLRRDVEEELGISVRLVEDDAYAYQQPSSGDAEVLTRSANDLDEPGFFLLREALVEHCAGLGLDARAGRAGEITVSGLEEPLEQDRFQIVHDLVLRLAREAYAQADALLVARARTGWRTQDTLADADVASHAVGRRANRVSGDGPRSGRVARIEGGSVWLQLGTEEVEAPASAYNLSVNSAVVAGWRGGQVLRDMRITTGEFTVTGRRNQHAVADRFMRVGASVRALGEAIALRGGGSIAIGRQPVTIRLEQR